MIVSRTSCRPGRGVQAFCLRAGAALRRIVHGTGEIEQVRALRIVELQRAGDGVEDPVRDTGQVATLQSRVVLGADAGEHRDLSAPQSGHAPMATAADPRPLRRQSCTARVQEVARLSSVVHETDATPLGLDEGCSANTRFTDVHVSPALDPGPADDRAEHLLPRR